MTELHVGSSHAILRCCRQTYEEARSIPFSANTWSFKDPCDLRNICEPFFGTNPHTIFDQKLAIRRLHLDIVICDELDEAIWNETFRDITSCFELVQYIYIDIEQRPYSDGMIRKWQFKNPAESSFLNGLMKLRESNLRFVSVTISDPHILHSRSERLATENGKYQWTMARKQVWAQHVEKALLRRNDQELAIGEGI